MNAKPEPIEKFEVGKLKVEVYEDRARMGRAAGAAVAGWIAERQKEAGAANVVFAAAPSQDEVLASLVADVGVDWERVRAFHMDEYLGLGPGHPASFRRYLSEHLFGLVGLSGDRLNLIEGERAGSPLGVCLEYEGRLKRDPVDVVCAGIGENGHLAFNDPPVADFLDPVGVKVVRLDHACRVQQVNDGCFREIGEVPTHAYTLTITALMAAGRMAVVVPGPRKARAVEAALRGPVDESCPASVLRNHPGAVLYLDRESARLVV